MFSNLITTVDFYRRFSVLFGCRLHASCIDSDCFTCTALLPRRRHGALSRRGRGLHAVRRGCSLLLCAWSLCTSVYVSLHVAGASPKSLYATLSRQKRNTVNNNKSVANVKIPGIFKFKTVVTIIEIE